VLGIVRVLVERRVVAGVLITAVHVVGHEVDRVNVELYLGHLGMFKEVLPASGGDGGIEMAM
jgi:hypothetical protein